tara:strand:- start:1032 stop:2138 length:1107 start_codon:yes stop_codon:yes gene_type:complete
MKICILKEKRSDEKRTPLVPLDIKKIISKYPNWKFYIEPSKSRIISDNEFYKVGCKKYKSQKIDLFISVKEISVNKIEKNNNYLMFSHTIKGQSHNLSLLKAFLKKDASLLDYELFKNDKKKRIIGFGWYAGVMGTYLTLSKLLNQKEVYKSDLKMIDLVKNLKSIKINNIRILITGDGLVSQGAQYLLNKIGIKKRIRSKDRSYYKVLAPHNFYKRTDGRFSYNDLLQGKGSYKSNFKKYLGKFDAYISCHYWDEKFPKLFELNDVNKNFFKIIGDITCDINGSVPTTIKTTNLSKPFYKYKQTTIMSVDNLPSGLPFDSSKYFSQQLMSLLPKIVKSLNEDSIEEYFLTKKGFLNYRYLDLLRKLV